MNKKVLIISPYFPPSNAADMQRVRMSLPYFKNFGWDAEVVMVNEQYTDMAKDELLLDSVPANIKIHRVKALDKKWTSKIGLGSVALRSLWYYRQKVNRLLKVQQFDLIYFSTTQFPVCVLGAYWKKRFGIPYVIDMQDPWHSEYYRDKPKSQQPPKYWLSYRLNKYLEPLALKNVSGLISVSAAYIDELKSRYPVIENIPAKTITFGSFAPDMEIAQKHKADFENLLSPSHTNMVYIGRGGVDMHSAVTPLFKAFKQGLETQPQLYSQLRFYFIGTSYAPKGQGSPTIMPLAQQFGIQNYVVEITDRISYYHTLATLLLADALFIPGSDDPKYTASKIYPYLLTQKPLLTIFNAKSPALSVLDECGVPYAFTYDDLVNDDQQLLTFFTRLVNGRIEKPAYNNNCLEKYSAENMTRQQCNLFNMICNT
jgi:hypothetical protein